MSAMPAELRRPCVVAGVFWLLWTVLGAWLMWSLATAWPYVGHPAQMALLLVLPGFLFRSAHLLWLWRARRKLSRWSAWGGRVLAFVVGVFIMPWDWLEARSMGAFEAQMAPLLAEVRRQLPAPCPPAGRYALSPELSDYLTTARAGSLLAQARLHHAGQRFVLVVGGRSIDIDGSTVFFDSTSGAWKKFHNDRREEEQALEATIKDWPVCKPFTGWQGGG